MSGRAFFEVWGDLEAQNRTLKFVILTESILLILAFGFLWAAIAKPPVVIRVSDVGRAVRIENLKTNNEITPLEIEAFTKDFIKNFREYSPFSLSEDLARAFNAMTKRFQHLQEDMIFNSPILKRVKQKEVASKVEIREVITEKQAGDILEIRALGVRKMILLSDEKVFQESLFQAELVLRKVSRHTNPYGLLVEDYREINLKDISEERSRGN